MSGELEKKEERLSLPSSGSPFLDQVRQQIIDTWTPEFYKKKVDEMMDAERISFDKDGNEHRTPDWKARKDGLDKMEKVVMPDLKEDKPKTQQPIKITINVNGKLQEPKTIEAEVVKESPPDPPQAA